MISLKLYRQFWESLADRVEGLRKTMPVTISEDMGKEIQRLGTSDTPVLFWLPPTAEARPDADCDSMEERNECVIFVMRRYDPQRSSALEALEFTLPIVENIKRRFLRECVSHCSMVRIEPGSISTMPETTFYRNFAGWSVAFTAIT